MTRSQESAAEVELRGILRRKPWCKHSAQHEGREQQRPEHRKRLLPDTVYQQEAAPRR
jgi:hypothetical protein